ncbi:MAG: universal stress protein [Burkholderiales bacterium]|nr:universal stress protein [Bacteroidia bacterium]
MKTIIAPTDFSPSANNAVDYAVELAKLFKTRIVLVNAYPIPETHYELGGSFELMSSIKNSSIDNLEQLKAQILMSNPEIEIDCISEMGHEYNVIVDAAINENADLIVMGTADEPGFMKENLFGSTAIEIARNQEVPTFIIPENVTYHNANKISFACDMQDTEKTDLVYVAKYFAKMFEAELDIVHIDDPEEEITINKATTSLFIERKLESVKHETFYITGKSIDKELESYFESHHTDVVLINPKKHNIFYRLFNHSITKELVYNSHKPILAIH